MRQKSQTSSSPRVWHLQSHNRDRSQSEKWFGIGRESSMQAQPDSDSFG